MKNDALGRAAAAARDPAFQWRLICGLLAAVVVLYLLAQARGGPCEGFQVTQRARDIAATKDLFTDGGSGSFREFRDRVPDGNAVEYSDARALARRGALTPETIQRALDA